MKKIKLFRYLFIAILAIGFASCGNDDDEDEVKTNQIKYGEVNVEAAGAIVMESRYESYSQYRLDIFSEGLSPESPPDNNSGFYLQAYLISDDHTLEGVYSLPTSTGPEVPILPAGNFFYG